MNSKKTIFLGLTGIIIAFVLLLAIVLLSMVNSQTPSNNNNLTSFPISNPNSNVIDINNGNNNGFDYAVITPEDTIELRNKLNESFIIGLERRNWNSIKWSPDSRLIAVLGESSPLIYDIYIYNTSTKVWSKVTNYGNFESGVEQFAWTGNNTILYIQGSIPNRWIHRYSYTSNESLKISNMSGDIIHVSPELSYVVTKATDSAPEIYGKNGELLNTLNSVKDVDTQEVIAIEDLRFFKGSEKILAQDSQGNYYKFNFGDSFAVKTSINPDYQMICSNSSNTFLGTLITSNALTFGIYNSSGDLFNILGEEPFRLSVDVDNSLSFCANNSTYLRLEFADTTNAWYKIEGSNIVKDAIFSDNKEIDIKKSK